MKKRILYVITKSNFGGAQRYVFELATAQREAGHEVAVATGGNGELCQRLQRSGITVYPIPSFQRDINLSKELRSLFELRQVIKTFRPTIVHLNSSKAGGSGALVARLLRVPRIIFTAHGWPFHEARNPLWRLAAWLASYVTTLLVDHVIVVSQYDHEHHHMPFIARKLTVIKTAVAAFTLVSRPEARLALFSPEIIERHQGDLWVVSTAELTPNKNLTAAITAVAEFNRGSERKLLYAIMGEGELRDELTTLTTQLGVTDQVKLLGFVPDGRTYLSAFDCFLLPSLKEGLPYALLEAGYAQLPCIAARVGGIPELITSEVSGLLIDPQQPQTITAALQLFTQAQDRSSTFGEHLYKKVTTDHTLEHMIELTTSVYLH